MKPKAYRRLNRELRDTGRGMSGSRDADVLVETVDDLADRFARRAPKTFFAGVRQPLANHAQALRKDADASGHVAALRGLAEDEWPLRGLDADALADALQRTYARGREAFATRRPQADDDQPARVAQAREGPLVPAAAARGHLARRDEGAGQGGQDAFQAARRGS